jgi:hypothetical protein
LVLAFVLVIVMLWMSLINALAVSAEGWPVSYKNQEVQVVEQVPEVEQPTVQEEAVVSVTYPVPMEQELQDFIISLCEEHHIEPGVVFAVIDRESDFRADAVGDNGKSFGLMQIQKRWHVERMEKLGCDDLLDPYQNVMVGIDYLAELFERENGVEWALAAYNAGASGANLGYGSNYAEEVLNHSDLLKGGVTYAVH